MATQGTGFAPLCQEPGTMSPDPLSSASSASREKAAGIPTTLSDNKEEKNNADIHVEEKSIIESDNYIGYKLPWLKSPVDRRETLRQQSTIQAETADFGELGWRNGKNHSSPAFIKHSGSTTYEMFFDLWFVACMSVFSDTHTTTDSDKLLTYLGYLTIIWVTWFLIGLFDVRFVTDSLFERITRTTHLGIMVGFSIVGTKFDPNKQEAFAFQGLSLILMVSRLVLAVQYATICWHIRKYRDGMRAVAITAVLHFVAAMIYLGITFRFEGGRHSRVFTAWYAIGIIEALIHLFMGLWSKALSFNGTHLTERMTVLTLIVIGEGVMGVAKTVVLIVQNDGWTAATIGVLISGIATSYFFFMIYFDWMHHHTLDNARQLFWAILHFPFHIALLLFMEGAANFITFWKIQELETWVLETFNTVFDTIQTDPDAVATSEYMVGKVVEVITAIFNPDKYHTTYTASDIEIDRVLQDIAAFPDDYWAYDGPIPELDNRLQQDLDDLRVTMVNALFNSFKIDFFQDANATDTRQMQYEAYWATYQRFVLVWQYCYVAAGVVLILLTTLFVLTKGRHGWTPFNYFRTALFYLLGIGTCLVLLLKTNDDHAERFMASPWLLPTLCLVMSFVLILTHLPSPPPFFFASPFGKKKKDGRQQSTSTVPLVDHKGGYSSVMQRAYEHGEDESNPVIAQARDGNPYVADTAYNPDVYLQYQWYQQRYEQQQQQSLEEKRQYQRKMSEERPPPQYVQQPPQQPQQGPQYGQQPQYGQDQFQTQVDGQQVHNVQVHQVQVQQVPDPGVIQQPQQAQQAQFPRYYYPGPPGA